MRMINTNQRKSRRSEDRRGGGGPNSKIARAEGNKKEKEDVWCFGPQNVLTKSYSGATDVFTANGRTASGHDDRRDFVPPLPSLPNRAR